MHIFLSLIIVGTGILYNEGTAESVISSELPADVLAVAEAEATELDAVQPEIVEAEATELDAVEPEIVEAEATELDAVEPEIVEAVESDASDVDQVTAAWSQLDPSTQAAILMLVEADRMMNEK